MSKKLPLLYFLIFAGDRLEDMQAYSTKKGAIAAFGRVARDLDRYGQKIEGAVHTGRRLSEISDYPDFVLSLGPRGGIKVENA